jgi:hypothetical protein
LRRYVPVRDGSLCGAAASSQLIQITTVTGPTLLLARRTRWRRTAWLGISDSNCRIRPRATQLDLRDNFAGGRRKSGGGDPSRTSCVAPTGGHHNRVRAMGIRDRPISPRSPWQNPVAERLIGTRTAFARGSDSAAAPVRPSSTEASVALRTSSGPSPGTVRLCSEPAFS